MSSRAGLARAGAYLLLPACAYLLYAADRAAAASYLLPLLVAALAYACAWRSLRLREAIALGLVLRLLAVFAFPLLSDDVYRFLWDGRLWGASVHPLAAPPAHLPAGALGEAGVAFAKTHAGLLAAMNSPSYYTVYPPLAQATFAVSAALAASTYWAAVWLKAILIVGECGLVALLWRGARCNGFVEHDGAGSLPPRLAVVAYWLHPLPIVELVGNAHFEGLAVLGAVGALATLGTRTSGRAATYAGLALAGGALVKLVPLIWAPAVALALLWTRAASPGNAAARPGAAAWAWGPALAFGSTLCLTVGLGFAALFAGADVSNFGESLDLYFRTFEFNGSLYGLARAAGQWYKGWNWIAVVGPTLSAAGAVAIVAISIRRGWRGRHLPTTLLWCTTVYLLCATTVHPWYFAYLVALAPLTPYRWPYVLGFAAFLSYLAYGTEAVAVPWWALCLEYLPVAAVATLEVRFRRH